MAEVTYSRKDQSLCGSLIDSSHSPKLRARVRRNAYDSQSYGIIESWTDAGWTQVQSYPIGDFSVSAQSYTTREDGWKVPMLSDLESLIEIGKAFFRG